MLLIFKQISFYYIELTLFKEKRNDVAKYKIFRIIILKYLLVKQSLLIIKIISIPNLSVNSRVRIIVFRTRFSNN